VPCVCGNYNMDIVQGKCVFFFIAPYQYILSGIRRDKRSFEIFWSFCRSAFDYFSEILYHFKLNLYRIAQRHKYGLSCTLLKKLLKLAIIMADTLFTYPTYTHGGPYASYSCIKGIANPNKNNLLAAASSIWHTTVILLLCHPVHRPSPSISIYMLVYMHEVLPYTYTEFASFGINNLKKSSVLSVRKFMNTWYHLLDVGSFFWSTG
jgi:hypothetical protein